MNASPMDSSAPLHPFALRDACTRAGGRLAEVENVFLSLVLAAMVVLPLAELVLRFFSTGIESATSLVQHLVLAVASIGAAIAARENKLLSFSAAQILDGRAAAAARLVSYALSGAVCALLFAASLSFVSVEMDAGMILAYGVPTWVFELVQPIGFGLITLHLLRHAASGLTGFTAAALLAVAAVALAAGVPLEPASLVAPALVTLLIATLLGAPIFVAVGGAALILLWGEEVPIASLAVDHYALAVNPSLPSIPMFTLAGFLLAESRAPQRLLAVFDALFGRLRGGAAVVTVLAATFFTCFTGASGVTILALGGLTMPLLLRAGYREGPALGLVAGGGSAGVLLMPALPTSLPATTPRIVTRAVPEPPRAEHCLSTGPPPDPALACPTRDSPAACQLAACTGLLSLLGRIHGRDSYHERFPDTAATGRIVSRVVVTERCPICAHRKTAMRAANGATNVGPNVHTARTQATPRLSTRWRTLS